MDSGPLAWADSRGIARASGALGEDGDCIIYDSMLP